MYFHLAELAFITTAFTPHKGHGIDLAVPMMIRSVQDTPRKSINLKLPISAHSIELFIGTIWNSLSAALFSLKRLYLRLLGETLGRMSLDASLQVFMGGMGKPNGVSLESCRMAKVSSLVSMQYGSEHVRRYYEGLSPRGRLIGRVIELGWVASTESAREGCPTICTEQSLAQETPHPTSPTIFSLPTTTPDSSAQLGATGQPRLLHECRPVAFDLVPHRFQFFIPFSAQPCRTDQAHAASWL